MKEFKIGLKDGIPIALGYLAVSFSVGIMAHNKGLTILQACVMSLTNVTSAGQYAGIEVIAAAGTIMEIILTQFIINLRYALMSLSLSQKLDPQVKLWQRFAIAFANTDEIFAVAIAHQKSLKYPYMLGLQLLPIIGWVSGTFLGGVAYELMPDTLVKAMSVMLYGMFIAIVFPEAKKKKSVLFVSVISVICSCLFFYVPVLNTVSKGITIIVCTVVAAVMGTFLWPIESEENEE